MRRMTPEMELWKKNGLELFKRNIPQDCWAGQEYLRLESQLKQVERRELNREDRKSIDEYAYELFLVQDRLARYNQMAFCDDFGADSWKYKELSDSLLERADQMMNEVVRLQHST